MDGKRVAEHFHEGLRRDIFDWLDLPFGEVNDLDGFENLVLGCRDRVVRITHETHRSCEQLLGELEFIRFLSERNVSVSHPLPLPDGTYLKSEDGFHICLFERIEGESLRGAQYPDELVVAWGESIGELHRVTRDFRPAHPRQSWREDENHQFERRIPAEETAVLAQGEKLMAALSELPDDDSVYGMIHSDAHPGNFLVRDGKPVFFDFDDCLYAWYGYDLATLLTGHILQPWVGESEQEIIDGVKAFLDSFLTGYQRANTVDALFMQEMPAFLKLRELSLYAVIHAFIGADSIEEDMPSKFMQGRRERIEVGRPVIDFDFRQFA